MVLRFEIEHSGLSDFFYFHIICVAGAVGYRHIGDVRHGKHQSLPLRHNFFQTLLRLGHASLQVLHLLYRHLALFVLKRAYLVPAPCLLGAFGVQLFTQDFAFVVNLDETVNVHCNMLLRRPRLNQVNILPNEMYVQHVALTIKQKPTRSTWAFVGKLTTWQWAPGANMANRLRAE